MDLFIVSLHENFWSPGKRESERWSGVFIWFNTLWLLPISKSEYFNEKYNSILERIGFWLIYPITDSSYRWKIKRTIIYVINAFSIRNSRSRYLFKDIYYHILIILWLFPRPISTFIFPLINSLTSLRQNEQICVPFLSGTNLYSFSYPPID